MATHSSTLVWKIPWAEEPLIGYLPWGHKEWDTTSLSLSDSDLLPVLVGPGFSLDSFSCVILAPSEYLHSSKSQSSHEDLTSET